MGTKMKGLLKGLRYISQIFDDEKEQEMQIGFPTDVKHVAHIGWDGPSVDSPSWMKEFKQPSGFQSAPLVIPPGDSKENPEIKWVSEDSKSSRHSNSPRVGDMPELPRSSRPHSEKSDSPKRESSRRHSRRHQSKESGGDTAATTTRSSRQLQPDSGIGSESPSRNLPDIPKKSRRKKSKENVGGGSSKSSSKAKETRGRGGEEGSSKTRKDELSQTSSLKPHITQEEEIGRSDIS